MLQFVYGHSGSGKSEHIYREMISRLQQGQKTLLLIPEHQVLLAEEALSNLSRGTKTLHLQVMSFRRLANHVFRTVGGLSYRYIERGAQLLVLWRAIMTCAPYIVEYRNVSLSEQGLLQKLLDLIDECKRYCVLPKQLEEAAREVSSNELRRKLTDFSLIFATYETLLHREYDDPADDLTRLSEILSENDLFSDTAVFVDSFFGFSGQELRILTALLQQAPSLTVSLPILPTEDEYQYQEICNTQKTLSRIAARVNAEVADPIVLEELVRFSSRAIPHLAEQLWKNEPQPYSDFVDEIVCYQAKDFFDEAEFVAQQIEKEVRNGISYREIAIVSRGIDRYVGMLDSVLATYQIPYFLSQKKPLATHSLVRFVKNLLAVISHSYQPQDIMACLKSGYLPFDADDCLLFENYLVLWGIHGTRFTDGIRWNMNPDGYTVNLRPDTAQRLDRIHAIRCTLTDLFLRLETAFVQTKTVHDAILTLYGILTETLQIATTLKEKEPLDAVLVYNTFLRCLEQLDRVAADMTVCSVRQFSDLLTVAVSQATLHNIPISRDAVVIGDAAQLRASNIKLAFVIGANEEAFPKTVSTQSLFSNQERKLIEACGVQLSDQSNLDVARELYYVTRALSLPSQRLYITCATQQATASSVYERIEKIFPTLPIYTDKTFPIKDRVFSPEGALQASYQAISATERQTLIRLLENETDYAQKREKYALGLATPSFTLSEATRSHLFSDRLLMSQSRLERFLACPLSYHCRYTLGLAERVEPGFHAADVGNFIHKILERCVEQIFSDSYDFPNQIPPDTALKELVSQAVREYIATICGKDGVFSIRLENLFRRMNRTAFLLLKDLLYEFRQSKFFPAFFELSMSATQEKHAAKTLDIPLADGSTVQIVGQIDRVDVYRRGKQIYLRVVDYKTGTKSFNMENIRRGIDLQMLIYLFALWKSPPPILREKLKAEQDCEFLPAGVLYFSARAPLIDGAVGEFTEKRLDHEFQIPRSGILLDDDEVLHAMEANLEGRFIPVTDQGRKTLVTLEGFGKLYESVQSIVAQIVTELRAGVAAPIPNEDMDACTYCPYSAICGKNKKKK